jgi:hypothetical protein
MMIECRYWLHCAPCMKCAPGRDGRERRRAPRIVGKSRELKPPSSKNSPSIFDHHNITPQNPCQIMAAQGQSQIASNMIPYDDIFEMSLLERYAMYTHTSPPVSTETHHSFTSYTTQN